jgi:hypothetical protein
MPWFSVMNVRAPLCLSNLRIFLIEACFYGGILLACIAIRRRIIARKTSL